MKKQPVVYQVKRGKRPAVAEPEFAETAPPHADMLRYDRAFHNPDNESIVVFPLLKSAQGGSYPDKITTARWDSFHLKLEEMETPEAYLANPSVFDNWITFVHETRSNHLKLTTLREFLAENKLKVNGWRSL